MNKRKLSILLTENNSARVDFFARSLKKVSSNFELKTFSSDTHLIGFFKSKHSLPDLVFLDPDLGGIECLKFIKSLYPSNNFHVIMLCSDPPQRHVDICYRLGATAYIQKTNQLQLMSKLLKFCVNDLKNSPIQEDFVLNKRLAGNK
jgi:DNA-binding NarL/FixJ family response regulator